MIFSAGYFQKFAPMYTVQSNKTPIGKEKNKMEHRDIQHPKSDAQIAAEKQNEHFALLNRIAELEKRVAALEAK